jgi:DNA-binding MurR/RpiR family transcriptional regulator
MYDDDIDHLIETNYESLSPQLRQAARFVIDNPEEIAVNSMRAAAAKAQVHPTSMLRLARQLGFEGYDSFRNRFRDRVTRRQTSTWSNRARNLRQRKAPASDEGLAQEIFRQEVENLRITFDETLAARLNEAEERIRTARGVYILGLRSLYPVAFYLDYVCRMFMGNVHLMSGIGGTFPDDLRRVDETDTLVAFSYDPYAADTVQAVAFAHDRGARIVAVTDSRLSPIATPDATVIVVSTTTSSLFPTILPAFAVVEALAASMVSKAGQDTMAEIARSEEQLARFGVYLER